MARFRVQQLQPEGGPTPEPPPAPSPTGAQDEPAYSQKAADKFASFRNAISKGREQSQREQEKTFKRYEKFRGLASESVAPEQRSALDRQFHERENQRLLAKCRAWSTDDFAAVRILGQGAFGIVHLVRSRKDGQQYALKQIDKAQYSRKNRGKLFAERDALAATRSRWCVSLHATFQDDQYVYMLMDFLPGGDLMFHLIQRDRFTPADTAFYMAELLEGLDFVHKAGFVHRDVKPDNLVLGSTGHLKLLDFGLCKQASGCRAGRAGEAAFRTRAGVAGVSQAAHAWGDGGGRRAHSAGRCTEDQHQQHASTVGTFEYMAPEAFFGIGEGGPAVDLWSLGVITFECLAGGIPFNMRHLEGVAGYECMREELSNYPELFSKTLEMTTRAGLTSAASNRLLLRLVCPQEVRLTAELARREPFFKGLSFQRLHLQEAPFARQCAAAAAQDGAANFEDLGTQALPPAGQDLSDSGTLEWAMYEFDREADELCRSNVSVELDPAPRPAQHPGRGSNPASATTLPRKALVHPVAAVETLVAAVAPSPSSSPKTPASQRAGDRLALGGA